MKLNIIVLACIMLFSFLFTSCGKEEKYEIKKGINISHWLSQSTKRGADRAAYFMEKDVAYLAGLGYDHLRIPIDEEQMFLPDGSMDTEAFQLLHNALGWCGKHNLKALVDLHILRSHHFNASEKPLFTDPKAQEQFYECWRKISGELKKYSNSMVAYELMNEPVADDPETWNIIVNKCASVVRKGEPYRTIVIGSNRWQNYATVRDLRLPENDPNIIISFHYYEPFLLTHYLAQWTHLKNYRGPVHYPGIVATESDLATQPDSVSAPLKGWTTRDYNKEKIREDFQQVLDVAAKYKLPVYCGEFGCIFTTPEEDKIRWYRDMCALFQEMGIAYASWDYKGGFGILSRDGQEDDMIEALTGTRPQPLGK